MSALELPVVAGRSPKNAQVIMNYHEHQLAGKEKQ
jgi:hypothetical protein